MSESPACIDLEHVGNTGEIASWIVGDVIIDCGPASCLGRLKAALGPMRPRALLLTHIHLDHAGAAGALVEIWPELEVHVHPIGLPHLASPSKLIRSASRLYGEDFDRLWGPVKPVPERNLRAIEHGARINGLLAAHTPGHASHHVSFLDEAAGRAYPGDAAGIRLEGRDFILPHAPPPDVDLEAWGRSLDLIASWNAECLHLPHFGAVTDVEWHLARVREELERKAEMARRLGLPDFVAQTESEFARLGDTALARRYRHTSPPEHMYLGLRRYWDRGAQR